MGRGGIIQSLNLNHTLILNLTLKSIEHRTLKRGDRIELNHRLRRWAQIKVPLKIICENLRHLRFRILFIREVVHHEGAERTE